MKEEDDSLKLTKLYFYEKFTDGLIYLHKIKKYYISTKSKFQEIDIVELDIFGKTLFLDKKMQSAQLDEYIFHESLVHPSLFLSPEPKKVFIGGGGEGATLREVLKHNTVEKAIMVDIDGELVELCKKYMPEWSKGAFEDKRAQVYYDDARKFLEETEEKFDVIIMDLTEPVEGGPSLKLFSVEFYSILKNKLNKNGIVVVQSGSADPFYNIFFVSIYKTLKEVFKYVHPYWAFVFSFQAPWGFVMASDWLEAPFLDANKLEGLIQKRGVKDLKYYNAEIHSSMFILPEYLKISLKENGRVIRDGDLFIWEA